MAYTPTNEILCYRPERVKNSDIYALRCKGIPVEVLTYKGWEPVYGSMGRDDEMLHVSRDGRVVPAMYSTYRVID